MNQKYFLSGRHVRYVGMILNVVFVIRRTEGRLSGLSCLFSTEQVLVRSEASGPAENNKDFVEDLVTALQQLKQLIDLGATDYNSELLQVSNLQTALGICPIRHQNVLNSNISIDLPNNLFFLHDLITVYRPSAQSNCLMAGFLLGNSFCEGTLNQTIGKTVDWEELSPGSTYVLAESRDKLYFHSLSNPPVNAKYLC